MSPTLLKSLSFLAVLALLVNQVVGAAVQVIPALSASRDTTFSKRSAISNPVVTTSNKYVVAHHMVGNTYPYTYNDWLQDVNLAFAGGIDGFALNIGREFWQKDQVANAFRAASASGTGFKLFISFDMTSLPCATPQDAAYLRSFITAYANHPNQLKYSLVGAPKPFASTFAGEGCSFGQGTFQAGWRSQFKQPLENTGPGVFFVPSFFVDPNTLGQLDFADGDYHWNSGWPIGLNGAGITTDSQRAANAPYVGSFSPDMTHIQGLSTSPTPKAYMAAVSPWFFTHYGPQSYNKNWIYLSDFHLYPKRWDTLIANRAMTNLAQIITWNDYGESHYIGPIKGQQPNSQAWVDGMPHTAWLDLTKYYATAYKTGAYPTITVDKIYLWARPHPRDATACCDNTGRPSNYQLTTDALWAVVFATSNATVTIKTSPTISQTFQAPAGVSKYQVPLRAGNTMSATMIRNGRTVASVAPAGFVFTASPRTYNFNAFVAASGASIATQGSKAAADASSLLPLIIPGGKAGPGSEPGGEGLLEVVDEILSGAE